MNVVRKARDYYDGFETPFYNNGESAYFARRRGKTYADPPEEIPYELYVEIWQRHMLHLMIKIIEGEHATLELRNEKH